MASSGSTSVCLVPVFSTARSAIAGQKSLNRRGIVFHVFLNWSAICFELVLFLLFACFALFCLFILIVNIFTFLERSLESHNICFPSLGLFRHDDLTQHLGSDFNFKALYKH